MGKTDISCVHFALKVVDDEEGKQTFTPCRMLDMDPTTFEMEPLPLDLCGVKTIELHGYNSCSHSRLMWGQHDSRWYVLACDGLKFRPGNRTMVPVSPDPLLWRDVETNLDFELDMSCDHCCDEFGKSTSGISSVRPSIAVL